MSLLRHSSYWREVCTQFWPARPKRRISDSCLHSFDRVSVNCSFSRAWRLLSKLLLFAKAAFVSAEGRLFELRNMHAATLSLRIADEFVFRVDLTTYWAICLSIIVTIISWIDCLAGSKLRPRSWTHIRNKPYPLIFLFLFLLPRCWRQRYLIMSAHKRILHLLHERISHASMSLLRVLLVAWLICLFRNVLQRSSVSFAIRNCVLIPRIRPWSRACLFERGLESVVLIHTIFHNNSPASILLITLLLVFGACNIVRMTASMRIKQASFRTIWILFFDLLAHQDCNIIAETSILVSFLSFEEEGVFLSSPDIQSVAYTSFSLLLLVFKNHWLTSFFRIQRSIARLLSDSVRAFVVRVIRLEERSHCSMEIRILNSACKIVVSVTFLATTRRRLRATTNRIRAKSSCRLHFVTRVPTCVLSFTCSWVWHIQSVQEAFELRIVLLRRACIQTCEAETINGSSPFFVSCRPFFGLVSLFEAFLALSNFNWQKIWNSVRNLVALHRSVQELHLHILIMLRVRVSVDCSLAVVAVVLLRNTFEFVNWKLCLFGLLLLKVFFFFSQFQYLIFKCLNFSLKIGLNALYFLSIESFLLLGGLFHDFLHLNEL